MPYKKWQQQKNFKGVEVKLVEFRRANTYTEKFHGKVLSNLRKKKLRDRNIFTQTV